ncbi:MAG: 2OG-Fe(II) oxygenase [Pseudomonadota bacterium]
MTLGTELLIEGQRLPNFLRPERSHRPVNYYAECCGRPQVLVVSPSPLAPEQQAQLSRLASGDALLVVLQVVSGPTRLAPIAGVDLLLADDGQVAAFLSRAPDPAVLVLDRQFRLLQRQPLTGTDPDQLRQRLEAADEAAQHAPVLVVPRVMSGELCRQLIAAYHQDNEASGVYRLAQGKAVYEPDPDVKIRREHRMTHNHPLWQTVETRLRLCLLPEIQWAFNYEVTHFEGVKVVAYDARDGGHFAPHRDNDGEDTAHRRFAMTLNLNTDDYAAGELCFPEYGQCFKPEEGAAVVFSCNLAHQARPVTEGVRFALVSFFYSQPDQFREVPMERRV